VRRFDGRKVPHEVIEGILGLALAAPSSKNTRSTRYMVVEEPQMLERISRMRDFGSAFLAEAPCAVLVLGDTAATDLWVDNAAIAATYLQRAAEEAGLGSCWVHVNGRPRLREEPEGATAEDYLREFLPIAPEHKPLCFIALGYPADTPKPHTPKDESAKIDWL
jgi:nitroreductase